MKRIAMLIIVLVGHLLFTPSGVKAAPAGTEHLPDLQTLTPADLQLDVSGGVRNLRFSNTVVNLGSGRLELRPENPKASLFGLLSMTQGSTRAFQVIYTHSSTGSWTKVREQQIGTFQYHSTHNHWHFEKFARYELFNSAADGSRGTPLNRVAEKTTFCIIDTDLVNSQVEHAGPQTYRSCGRDSTTGLTVGWGDKYGYQLDGQSIDMTGLPDGNYWLMSTADYAGRILETNDANNSAQVKFRLSGNTVTVIS